jgi:ABC-type multidrug transport system fused ATPase/permease subunit
VDLGSDKENTKPLLRVWNLLSKVEKKKLILISFVQTALGFLDLIAVAIIGVIATISVTGFGVKGSNSTISRILEFLKIQNLSLQSQVAFLGSLAVLALIIRTVCTAYFTRRIIAYLSHKGAELSARAIGKTFETSILKLQERNQQEIVFAVTSAPMYLFVGVIGSLMTVISDSSLLVILICALMFVDVASTLFTLVILGTSSYLIYRMLRNQSRILGEQITHLNVESNTQIIQVLESFRFLRVRDRTSFVAKKLEELRLQSGLVTGKIQFMPHISKYYVEIALIVFTFSLAAVQFLLEDATKAISTLAIFFLAGSRIAPAALRIQQGALLIRNNLGITSSSLPYLEDLEKSKVTNPNVLDEIREILGNSIPFSGEIVVRHASFKYPNSTNFALEDVSFSIMSGSFNSIVGHSGSGKSTLADLILGIIDSLDGEVLISGMKPREAIRNWPGMVAYVPQTVSLISGTIRENIVWGYEDYDFKNEEILNALEIASLDEMISNLPDGLNSHVGDKGVKLSGGQRQRLGIARALLTKPKILILDEATSSLDATTEAEISEALKKLRGNVTLIVIAHRLSTVKLSDQVIYLKSGKILDIGRFEEIRSRNQEFDSQALLMGL